MPKKPVSTLSKSVPAMLADTDFLFRQAKLGSEAFIQALPFPHLYLQSLIKSPCCNALYEGLGVEGMTSIVRMLVWELSSSTLIRHFASLTGKPPMLPDPFLINSGPRSFSDTEIVHAAEREFFSRHPQTQLQNVLRIELFVSSEPHATFAIELINKAGHTSGSHIGTNGSVLFVNSDNYYLRYRFEQPAQWRTLLAYYYINDHARSLGAVGGVY